MPVVSGELFARSAQSYNGRGLTYQNYDCIHFANLVRETCGLNVFSQSTNRVWRGSGLTWKGTIQEARAKFNGVLPLGLWLFHVIPDSDPDADPDHYGYGDGIGDVNHVGIYVGTDIGAGVMQSGGYGGTGVHESAMSSYFNLAGCATGIDYTGLAMPLFRNPSLYRSFYVMPNEYFDSRSVLESDPDNYQKQNANAIKSFFTGEGWTLNSVCGILGNMQFDSSLNPAFIQALNRYRLPNNAVQLADLYNYVMQDFNQEFYNDPNNNYAIGLVQRSATTRTNYLTQNYCVAYAIRTPFTSTNSTRYNWFDGWYQCKRINTERAIDSQTRYFDPVEINGVRYTFSNYAQSYSSPEDLANAWMQGYQQINNHLSDREANARYWFDYFSSASAPAPITEPQPEPYVIPEKLAPWLIPCIINKRKKGRPCIMTHSGI